MKYYKLPKRNNKPPTNKGRLPDCADWISGPCPVMHDKYYAWLKHRAQARYRHEDYELSWADWCELWTPELWPQRGKQSYSMCLQRKDIWGPWSLDNCEVVTRLEQLRRRSEYRV